MKAEEVWKLKKASWMQWEMRQAWRTDRIGQTSLGRERNSSKGRLCSLWGQLGKHLRAPTKTKFHILLCIRMIWGSSWTSLLVQWLRIHQPMQQSCVPSLIWEDSTCPRVTIPMCHTSWACAPQQWKLPQWEAHTAPKKILDSAFDCKEIEPVNPKESPCIATKIQHSQKWINSHL